MIRICSDSEISNRSWRESPFIVWESVIHSQICRKWCNMSRRLRFPLSPEQRWLKLSLYRLFSGYLLILIAMSSSSEDRRRRRERAAEQREHRPRRRQPIPSPEAVQSSTLYHAENHRVTSQVAFGDYSPVEESVQDSSNLYVGDYDDS